jgi:hypothetical protein
MAKSQTLASACPSLAVIEYTPSDILVPVEFCDKLNIIIAPDTLDVDYIHKF